jgi:hypothetical protein
MRQALIDLIKDTIVYQYDLPNSGAGILKTMYSTDNDKCYLAKDTNNIADIIYNSIVDYAFNEFDIDGKDLNVFHEIALKKQTEIQS